MPDVHRAGWIGRHELHIHALAFSRARAPEGLPLGLDRRQRPPPHVGRETKIEEARARDLERRDGPLGCNELVSSKSVATSGGRRLAILA